MEDIQARHPLTRRNFLKGLGALGIAGAGSMALAGCSSEGSAAAGGDAVSIEVNGDFKDATEFTKQHNKSFGESLPFDDTADFENAQKDWIATVEGDGLYNSDEKLIWDITGYQYQQDSECPDTVNPSLWRQARLNTYNGLFKVMDGVYQVRNLDLANMTIIEGETGVIVIDCTSSNEAAKAGLELYHQYVDANREVTAVCVTHSHTDHYGGLPGVLTKEQVASGKVPIVVPANYMLEVASENAYAGDIMSRRTYDQYGTILDKGPQAHVDTGLAKQMVNGASRGIYPPNKVINNDLETLTLDGIEFEFMLTPNTEAPAEYIMWVLSKKLLIPAELGNHVVFANPSNQQGLAFLADTYEQLGYQAECATWRCVYLMGAKELRVALAGKSANPNVSSVSAGLTNAFDDDMFFDFMALHLNAPRAAANEVTLQVEQTDQETTWALQIKNGVLNFHQDKEYPSFDAKVKLVRDNMSQIIIGTQKVDDLLADGTIEVTEGDAEKVKKFFSYFDVFHVEDINVMLP